MVGVLVVVGGLLAGGYALLGSSGRDPRTWPFASSSIWNMPIGSAARYVPFYATTNDHGGVSSIPGIVGPGITVTGTGAQQKVTAGAGVNSGVDTDWIFYASASDPLVTVYRQEHWVHDRCVGTSLAASSPGGPTPLRIRMPADAVIPDASQGSTPNNSAAVVQPDGSIAQFNVAARCSAASDALHATPDWQFVKVGAAARKADENISAAGMYGGHGGSGLSALGGTLTASDVTSSNPIHHALAIDVNGAEYLAAPGGDGHVWPAVWQDACATCASYLTGYHGTNPDLRMGSLLAVPPQDTEQGLHLTTALGKKLFHAFQDYGAYVVDDTGWSSVDINVDQDADQAAKQAYGYPIEAGRPNAPWGTGNRAYYDDLTSIYAHLEVVANNGPHAIGGGGTPRAALAPQLAG